MVKYYITLDVYGERACLPKLEEFCKERNLAFEYNDRFDRDSYKEYKEEAQKELGFDDVFRAYITFRSPEDCQYALAELDVRNDINICVKIDA